MTYLLDTDTLSNLVKPTPSMRLVARLASVPTGQQSTSSITLGELVYGARRLGPRGERLMERIERLVLQNLSVLAFDEAAARRYGEVRAELERKGTPIGDADLRIAAIALAEDLTVVTGNTRHFEVVPGLRVENWL